ncbi:methylenetetrahydrofolate reductase [Anaeroselena agilis]|uniref:Methylenetetrahydrofolate reductase n=1 Tax=Anaeroselena agilis TaxID=3063788 RepID=A0ABU3P0I0_9FIRM|nr:methylenetetrahydrofolate reductase [Selenomonadales bacterium 4137-cl]
MSEPAKQDGEFTTESKLERLFARGEFVVTSEIGPQKGASAESVIHHTEQSKAYCDGFNITDNQSAVVRLSSIAAAVHIMRHGGNPVIQMTCRDRNRIAIQSDLLGAYSLGVRDVLCLSGDHQSFGNHPTARNVFDIDSIQLIALVKMMRDERRLLCGDELKTEPRFYIGAVESPTGDPVELRVMRLAKKVRAGAQFIQTQAVFDVEKFAAWMDLVRNSGLDQRVNIMAGVIPVKSVRALRYMKDNVAGISVPDELVDRMANAENPQEEGKTIAVELIAQLRRIAGVKGIHIMPVGWEDVLPEIVTRAGLQLRPVAD